MADPAIIQYMQQRKQLLLSADSRMQELFAARWRDIEAALETRIMVLAEELAQMEAAGDVISQSTLFRMARYQTLLAQTQVEIDQLVAEADRTISSQQRTLARQGIDDATTAVRAQTIRAGVTALPIAAVENMIGVASDGSPLALLLREAHPAAAARMTDVLLTNTALGVNPRQTAREMQQATRAGLDRMLTIARTEQLRVYRQASIDTFKATGLVPRFKRLATRDRRTCLQCLVLDGKTYALDEIMPTHPNCRCVPVPVVTGAPALRWQIGRDWLTEQPAEVQREIMGAARYEAWAAGELALADMVRVQSNPIWGPSPRTVPRARRS